MWFDDLHSDDPSGNSRSSYAQALAVADFARLQQTGNSNLLCDKG